MPTWKEAAAIVFDSSSSSSSSDEESPLPPPLLVKPAPLQTLDTPPIIAHKTTRRRTRSMTAKARDEAAAKRQSDRHIVDRGETYESKPKRNKPGLQFFVFLNK